MEYDKLKQMLDYHPSNGIYEDLMVKEADVLKTINRVVDHSNKIQLESNEVVNIPLRDLTNRFGVTMKDMFNELFAVQDAKALSLVFTKSTERLIYTGAAVVLLALFLYFISVTN